MIQLLVLNQIPMQYVMRNYVVVVLHFSDEKLVGGLTRKTIDIPTDMRPDGIRKLRLSAQIRPVNPGRHNGMQKPLDATTRLCNVRYLHPGMTAWSLTYIVTPKKNGYIYSKDTDVSNLMILEVLKHIMTKNYDEQSA